MSISSVGGGSLPDPAFYTYTPVVPAGLSGGSPAAPAPNAAPATNAASSSAPASVSPYAAAYATLQQQDAAELLQVSLGTPAAAQSNVASVLAQAAALQNAQNAAQTQAAATAAEGAATAASGPDPLSAIPSFESIVSQSDRDARAAASATGSVLDTTA